MLAGRGSPARSSRRLSPPVALSGLVADYVDYTMAGWPGGVHRAPPSAYVAVVINLAGQLLVSDGRDGGTTSAQATVGGLRDSPVMVGYEGGEQGVQLALTPAGARSLLGVPAAAVAGQVVPLDEVIGREGIELVERLAGVAGAEARRLVVEAFLVGRLGRFPDGRESSLAAWRAVVASGGRVPVRLVAERAGWSRRHLDSLLAAEVGVAPKALARVVRFSMTRRGLLGAARPSLTAAAASFGYADQAHLTREWQALAGCAPSTWMAEELPFLQDIEEEQGSD